MTPDGLKWGQEAFFPTNPDLADILGRTDYDFENFYFLDFFGLPTWARLGPSLGPAWARAWALAWAQAWARAWARAWAQAWAQAWARAWAQAWAQTPAPAPDEFSDPNLTPLPTHPGIKYVARTLAAINPIHDNFFYLL